MYQTPDKPHAHGKRPCRGLEKCCFCPVWKPPRRPGSPAAVPSPRLPGTAGGSGRLSESDAWVTTSRWPPFNGQRRHLSSLPPSSFSLLLFFFSEEGEEGKMGREEAAVWKAGFKHMLLWLRVGKHPPPDLQRTFLITQVQIHETKFMWTRVLILKQAMKHLDRNLSWLLLLSPILKPRLLIVYWEIHPGLYNHPAARTLCKDQLSAKINVPKVI